LHMGVDMTGPSLTSCFSLPPSSILSVIVTADSWR
jgi:hypothetical protein